MRLSHAGPALFAWQFSQLAKYDVTGIGLNIGETTTLNGEPSLKVFGLVLGSPAQLAGVRQVSYSGNLSGTIFGTISPYLYSLRHAG